MRWWCVLQQELQGGVVVHAEGCVGACTGRRATQSYFSRPKREQRRNMRNKLLRRTSSCFLVPYRTLAAQKPRGKNRKKRARATQSSCRARINHTDRSRTRAAAVSSHRQLHQSGSGSDAQQPRRITRDRRRRGRRNISSPAATIVVAKLRERLYRARFDQHARRALPFS